MNDDEYRQRQIEAHILLNGKTDCPPGGTAKLKTSLRSYKTYWRRRGSKGSKSARSPFFARGGGCL